MVSAESTDTHHGKELADLHPVLRDPEIVFVLFPGLSLDSTISLPKMGCFDR
jgi:hypothetical protein